MRFGDGNPVEKLPKLEALLRKLEQTGVNPFDDLVYIDLRFGNMAAYMDRATASDVDSHQYDKVQQELDAAEEAYQKLHGLKAKSGDDSDDDDTPKRSADKADGSEKYKAATRTAPQRSRNSTNYQQYPQQNVPQQYYQQRQPNPAPQYAPMYNLPANQQRY